MRPCPQPSGCAGLWGGSERLKDSSDIFSCMGQGGLCACLAVYEQGGSAPGLG